MVQNRNRAGHGQTEAAPAVATGGGRRNWLTGVIIASVVIAIIVIVFGVFYYQQYVAPFRRTIITVDGNQIRMDYFLKRAQLAGSDPMFMLQALSNELIVKSAAPQYGISVTGAEIDSYLRHVASEGGGDMTDVEFKEWYRQQMNNNRLTEAQYREIAASSLLMLRMQEYLAERTPSVGEQVRVSAIAVRTFEEAQSVQGKLKGGADFATLAKEVSIDGDTKDQGGELGWMAQGASIFDGVVFDLSVGEISEPYPYYQDNNPQNTGKNPPDAWFVLKVSDKDAARQLDERSFNALKSRALEIWLQAEVKQHSVRFNFNSENYAWMKWQLAKLQAK
ncbi:MAG: peptidylprolyl isomerase [Chloroflexi bacterium]|nr:peptidylprolyl isomerase [Chloroflexota bacterium]